MQCAKTGWRWPELPEWSESEDSFFVGFRIVQYGEGALVVLEEGRLHQALDNQLLKRPIHRGTDEAIAGLLEKSKKRGEIMALLSKGREEAQAGRCNDEATEVPQGTAILAPQLFRFTRKAPRCYTSNHSMLRYSNSSTSLQARNNIPLQHSSTIFPLQSCSALPTDSYSFQVFLTSSQPNNSHHAACSTPFIVSPSIATPTIQPTDGDYILAALSAKI
ncbi:hypothetical protein GN244_ATG10550 [Phytophthora infestans]|uniref:Uncharacterized protein n=1 Tax=Phytophthora infestans TaxID=4787 RepID=A0A833SNV6_PHYIN|nr:hypothetical protein GN244_ATG10550 [Phytophthora infestans]KAF4148636.1 hypothetical protein GN958_ATG02191 [Phytophthora infestans]KAF4148849.1 hypothetical protein GN958_ATG01923 [Phytophthora infestans]